MSAAIGNAGPLVLPQPDNFDDWRDWARSVNQQLDALNTALSSQAQATYYNVTNIAPGSLPEWPDGYTPLWFDEATSQLFLANPAFDPPTGGDIVFIDTAAIADAAIETGKLDDSAVSNAKILNATIGSAKIANAAIVTALIGDLQVVTAKINDAAINNAKIANLAVDGAKIANASIGAAHIIDASITNAKIAGTITSAGWNPTTKSGWSLDKSGNIEGQGIALYDNSGVLIFGSGGTLDLSRVAGAGALAALSHLTLGDSELIGFGALAGLGSIGLSYVTDAGALAAEDTISSASQIDDAVITAAKLVALILTTSNITTYIQGAAIGAALIANAAIGTAAIADAAIVAAKIGDAEIGSAKISDLVVDRLTSGTLDAVMEFGDGLLSFTVGASALYVGNGFGDSSQFFLWFGPSSSLPADATESTAVVFLKTDGSAYFGGSLSAGTIRYAFQNFDGDASATLETDHMTFLGGTRQIIVSYTATHHMHRVTGGALSGTSGADVELVINGVSVDTEHFGNSAVITSTDVTDTVAGSFTYSDTSGGTDVVVTINVTRTDRTWPGSPPDLDDFDEQGANISVVVTEE